MTQHASTGPGPLPTARKGPDQPICAVCAAPLRLDNPVVTDPQTGDRFAIWGCPVCGLGHTRPQPEDLGRYYGAAYYGGRHGITERICMARRLRILHTLAEPGRLLDFGCGDGGFLAAAAACDWRCEGVDIMPDDARARGLKASERLSDIDGPFDAITLWHSLEHLRQPLETLTELAGILKPGGILIAAVPNRDSLQARWFGRHWFHNDVPRHLFHFTPDALATVMQVSGLTPIRRWNLEIEHELFGWPQSLLNAVLPTPNILFDVVTRRKRRHRPRDIAANLALGSLATAMALPFLPLSTALGCGAVVIMAAQRPARTPA